MPVTIARTPWIDDDGTGTTGTVLNNAVKTELYNQIDGALVQVAPAPTAWVDLPFSAGLFTADGGGAWVVPSALTLAYCRAGNVVHVMIYLQGSTLTGAPAQLNVSLAALGIQWRNWTVHAAPVLFGATHHTAVMQASQFGQALTFLRDFNTTAWPAGNLTVSGTFTLPIL